MVYDVKAVAEELMLGTEDLRSIFQQFFDDTRIELEKCKELTDTSDFDTLLKIAHSIKGVASNLRMTLLSDVARSFETCAKDQNRGEINNELKMMCNTFISIQDQVRSFYA